MSDPNTDLLVEIYFKTKDFLFAGGLAFLFFINVFFVTHRFLKSRHDEDSKDEMRQPTPKFLGNHTALYALMNLFHILTILRIVLLNFAQISTIQPFLFAVSYVLDGIIIISFICVLHIWQKEFYIDKVFVSAIVFTVSTFVALVTLGFSIAAGVAQLKPSTENLLQLIFSVLFMTTLFLMSGYFTSLGLYVWSLKRNETHRQLYSVFGKILMLMMFMWSLAILKGISVVILYTEFQDPIVVLGLREVHSILWNLVVFIGYLFVSLFYRFEFDAITKYTL